MSVQMEKLEHNMAKLTITVPAGDFDNAIDQSYHRRIGQLRVPGFRKGKAPRPLVEKMFGKSIFYEDAANILIPTAYENAVKELDEMVVSRPEINVVQIGKGEDFIFTAEVALKPEATLGQYKGLEIPKQDTTVTDEQVQAKIDQERENNARMIDIDDRPVENGDIVRLDFNGSVDGVPFEGGQASDHSLTIGSGAFIPGFEEQVIGHRIGEDFDVNVTFPENYHSEELKGKPAVFACKVNSIQKKELPELDDEFAQDVSEFDTLEEYRADVRARLQEQKDASAKTARENAAVAKAVDNAEMEIPEAMVTEQAQRLQDEFAQRLQSQGMNIDQYMKYTGMNTDLMKLQWKMEAERRIRTSLVLEAVAKAENIEVSDEQTDDEIAKMAEMYSMDVAQLKEAMGKAEINQIKMDLAVAEAVKVIADSAVETEAEPETEDGEAKES